MRKITFFVISVFIFCGCSDQSRRKYNIPNTTKQNIEVQQNKSLEVLSDAIKNNPSNPENYFKRAVVNLNLENYTDALVDISKAESLNPNSGLYLFIKAKVQNLLNEPQKAISNAIAAENQNYDMPELYTLIGDLYTKLGKYQKAQAYINKAESIYPYNSDVFLVKGKYYAKRGDTLTSILNYNRAIKLKPHNFESYDDLIKIYNKKHLVDSALVLNELAIKRFPHKKEMVYNKAQILENIGLLDSAVKVYRRYYEGTNPKKFDVLGRIGAIYLRKKNFNGAVQTYEYWAKEDPENITPLKKAAACFELQKRYTVAKKYIERALRLDPDNENLAAILASYDYRIEAANRADDYERDYYTPATSHENVQPEPQRKIFGGTIETIQKRNPMTIGKDSTRN